jgi:carbamate kinase
MSAQNHVSIAPAPDGPLLTESQTERLAAGSDLVYRGEGTVIIAGRQFRRVYVFSPQEPEQFVEAQDVDALVKTGLFLIRR